jgi:Endonuclease-reverse transcriptase
MLQLPGYKLEGRKDRKDTRNGIGGGLIFYVKDCYDAEPVTDESNDFNQYSMLSLNTKSGKVNLLLIYRPPSSNADNLAKLCELLSNVKSNTIAVGDFNLPGINWATGTADGQGRRLLDVLEAGSMTQLVDFPTHRKGNVLDLVITNCNEKIKSVRDIGCLSTSDHCMIMIDIETKAKK